MIRVANISIFTSFVQFLIDLTTGTFEGLTENMKVVFTDLFRTSFMIEKANWLYDTPLKAANVDLVFQYLYLILVVLLSLKFLWKGYKTYVLWRDGEAETPPGEMALGAVTAVATAVLFPIIYELLVEAVCFLGDKVVSFLTINVTASSSIWDRLLNLIHSLVLKPFKDILAAIVALVMLVICWVQMFIRSAELLVYRLGVPLAVTGIVDSDGGIWRSYVQALVRQFATVLTQYILMMIGFGLMVGSSFRSLVLAIGFEIASVKMPKMMSQLLLPSGGGSNMMTVATVVRMFLK